MFITSKLYTGDLDGVAGADATCSELAEAAGLVAALEDGEEPPEYPFRAWLSVQGDSVDTRFAKHGIPYITRAGEIIADDWDALTDPSVLKPQITQTELPMVTSIHQRVWTNTRGDGSLDSATLDCGGWELETNGIEGRFGTTSVDLNMQPEIIEAWTHLPGPSGQALCQSKFRLYCFEQ